MTSLLPSQAALDRLLDHLPEWMSHAQTGRVAVAVLVVVAGGLVVKIWRKLRTKRHLARKRHEKRATCKKALENLKHKLEVDGEVNKQTNKIYLQIYDMGA